MKIILFFRKHQICSYNHKPDITWVPYQDYSVQCPTTSRRRRRTTPAARCLVGHLWSCSKNCGPRSWMCRCFPGESLAHSWRITASYSVPRPSRLYKARGRDPDSVWRENISVTNRKLDQRLFSVEEGEGMVWGIFIIVSIVVLLQHLLIFDFY